MSKIKYYMQIDKQGIPTAFFTSDIHKKIPSDAIEISEAEWKLACTNPAKYKWENNKFIEFDINTIEPLDKLKKQLILQVKNFRKQYILKGITINSKKSTNSYLVTINSFTKINLSEYILAFKNGSKNISSEKILWKFDNNIWYYLSYDELIEINSFISSFVENCFKSEYEHVENIKNNVKNYKDFRTYNIKDGWPKNIFNSKLLD